VDFQRITPVTVALLWRLAGMLLLCGLWLSAPGSEVGLILVLALAILGFARWRFALPAWTTLVDQAAGAVVAAFSWPSAAFAFALPAFDACLAARPAYALPILVALFVLRAWSLPVAAALAAAALAGFAVHLWSVQLQGARAVADRDRRERYEQESLQSQLLAANLLVARMAGIAERARIARALHDHAGHEITAAGLALDAYRGLRDEGDPQADELLAEARRRIADGMAILRRTARGIAPESAVGVGALAEICRRFSACPVAFVAHGDTAAVPVHAWGVLEPCLKEALTNATRHEAPGRIDVTLDVGPHIVRLSVHHPVRGQLGHGRGLGLRSLAQRAEAVGGSIAIDARDGFRLVCVLPLGRDEPPGGVSAGAPTTEAAAP